MPSLKLSMDASGPNVSTPTGSSALPTRRKRWSFVFNDTATTEIYTLSLHDALPIWVARLMIHTPTAISIFVCLSMVQLMAVFISMRCTLCGHFLQVALTLILVVGYAIAAS